VVALRWDAIIELCENLEFGASLHLLQCSDYKSLDTGVKENCFFICFNNFFGMLQQF